jgi:anti-sigma factor RsiW
MTADVHSLAGAYALDALNDIERASFDRHLRECDACRAEADELREAAARLADGAWSVPPPGLRDSVLAEIANTRQLPPPGPTVVTVPGAARPPRHLRLVAAAAVLLAAAGAGTAVFALQNSRVRDAQTVAEQARSAEARVRAILAAPDVVLREQPLSSGGRVTVASSRLQDAGVIMLGAASAPDAGRTYQLWTIDAAGPASAGVVGEGQSSTTRIVEGLPGASAVGVTVENAPGAQQPSDPLEALVELT